MASLYPYPLQEGQVRIPEPEQVEQQTVTDPDLLDVETDTLKYPAST